MLSNSNKQHFIAYLLHGDKCSHAFVVTEVLGSKYMYLHK